MKYVRLLAAGLALTLLAGCSILPYQTPEEQRAAQEAVQAAQLEAQTQIDPQSAFQGDFPLHKILSNAAGTILADYSVTFPYFNKTGEKAQSFARINEYYQNEMAGLNQDAEAFFEKARAAYGIDWNQVTQADKIFALEIGYELLEAPEGYLCVRCDFHVEENGQTEEYSKAQVFLLDNGWRLSLETLLGEGYSQAAPKLLSELLKWCEENGLEVTTPESRTLEEFSQDYALTTEGFIFYTQPFQLNNKEPGRFAIPVSLASCRQLLEH